MGYHNIELFTKISGDRNPFYYYEEIAGATYFGGIVVSGGVASTILNSVVTEKLPGPDTVFLQVNRSIKYPVKLGNAITSEAKITKVREDKLITALEPIFSFLTEHTF